MGFRGMYWEAISLMRCTPAEGQRSHRHSMHGAGRGGFEYTLLPVLHCGRYSKENVDLAAALLTLACLGEGKDISWQHEPRLRALLGLHSVREAGRRALSPLMLSLGSCFILVMTPCPSTMQSRPVPKLW